MLILELTLMRALVLGCGNIGSVAAEDLAESRRTDEIVVADKSEARAKEVVKKIGGENVSWIELDASKYDETVNVLKRFDLALGFLPGKLGYQLTKACIDARTDLVDVSYMAKNPMTLDGAALEAGITVVPDCGFAPGISNVLVGHAVGQLDSVKTVHIMVGGLPEKKFPPLDYIVTWSPENLIDEYTRKTTIVRERKEVEVETLSGLEEIDFPKVGKQI
jgi:saccharopine dehydrogenase-like NADP-dependent oxidoreductase